MSRRTQAFDAWHSWDSNPLYALVHEAIYCQVKENAGRGQHCACEYGKACSCRWPPQVLGAPGGFWWRWPTRGHRREAGLAEICARCTCTQEFDPLQLRPPFSCGRLPHPSPTVPLQGGEASNWAADRVRAQEPFASQFDAVAAAEEGRRVLFTGECVYR